MNRRQFLSWCTALGISALFPDMVYTQGGKEKTIEKKILNGMLIINAHAHPEQFHLDVDAKIAPDFTSTLKAMNALGMNASCFAALGDTKGRSGQWYSETYSGVITHLDRIKRLAKKGKVKVVLKSSDVPYPIPPGEPLGAILAIEGGNPLGVDTGKVDEFYKYGVRMIQLVHYSINEIGDIMTALPKNNGLTPSGRNIVERMQEVGIIVDVAHAHIDTLKQVADISKKPLVDSHTSLCPVEDPPRCHRFRTLKEIEMIVKTGGIICTWPFKYKTSKRKTFHDWAQEVLKIKQQFGIEHVGLGTDDASIPLIDGYNDVRDLEKLAQAMKEVGLTRDDIAAYMGGNFYRILKECIG
jgi:membrane dipeptidase